MCQAVTPYLCVTTRMDAHVCAHVHKINTDRVTENLSCSRSVAQLDAVLPVTSGLLLTTV